MEPLSYNGDRWSNASADVIEIQSYDPQWPLRFSEEAARLRSVLPADLNVTLEHFGSTAVLGLAAKPILDIMLIAPDQAQWQSVIAPLEALGYLYWAENPRSDRMFFVKGMPPFGRKRSHHVHVRLPQDAERELCFRDYLRLHPKTAAQYAALKQELAARFPADREAYTQAKTPFIEAVLQQARTAREHGSSPHS
jgi:GrpB-like predicted nucleotidyltransferase (UPF0157 family)